MPASKYILYEAWGGTGFIIREDGKVREISWPIYSHQQALSHMSYSLKIERDESDMLSSQKKELENYFYGKQIDFLSWDLAFFNLTKFQRSVTEALLKIPYGKTISYKDLAKKAGYPNASRAVGSVVSKNLFPIIIPCHRVIKADGSLGGWSGPNGWKERLLELEKA
jgi:methylated-DNA-[protein]-cysteine S-methyltransferase